MQALPELAEALLEKARSSTSGRASETVFGGHEHTLRQTMIALLAGHSLGEHASPGDATLQVIHGRVTLRAGAEAWPGSRGDLLVIPPARHSLDADEDAVVLLTVATSRG